MNSKSDQKVVGVASNSWPSGKAWWNSVEFYGVEIDKWYCHASRSLPHSSVETDYLTILDWLTPRCHCQRAAKKHGLAALSLCRPQFVGQWRQCLFSVIYRLVAIPKNLFVNHEFKVGSESGRCCIIASTSLRLSDIRKKALNDERSLCACSKTPRLSKTIWTTVTNHIAIRTSALWDWYVRSEKSSQNHVKFVALSSMENMIPARC